MIRDIEDVSIGGKRSDRMHPVMNFDMTGGLE